MHCYTRAQARPARGQSIGNETLCPTYGDNIAARVRQLAIFHHDPDHDDDFMAKLETEARAEWKGALVAREQMILTPGAVGRPIL